MHHQSTIYIRKDLYDILMNAVEQHHIKRSRLIEALLIKYMDKSKAGTKILEMSRNQKIDKGIKRGRICIFWRYDVYERSLDAKKAFKKSVSYIIAEAILYYLDELINEIMNKKTTYNYNQFYLIFTNYHQNVYSSAIFWGDPGPEVLHKMLKI